MTAATNWSLADTDSEADAIVWKPPTATADNADLEMKLRRVDAVESFDWDGGLVSSMEVASQLGFVLH
jgi:hypothetical protein